MGGWSPVLCGSLPLLAGDSWRTGPTRCWVRTGGIRAIPPFGVVSQRRQIGRWRVRADRLTADP